MRNRKYFKTDWYFGVDLIPEFIETGIANEDQNTYGLLDDMRNLHLPPASADLIVSTHTLDHLKLEDQAASAKSLSNIVKPGGHMLVNKLNDAAAKDVLEILVDDFEEIEQVYYGGKFACSFEERMMKLGERKSLRRIVSAFAKLLSFIDRLTSNRPDNTRHVYLRCKSRRNSGQQISDIMTNAVKLGDRFYTHNPANFPKA